jgi:hypothetical protein
MRNSYLIQLHVSGDVGERERFPVQLFMSGMRSDSTRDHKRRENRMQLHPSDLGSGDHGCTNLTGLVVGGIAQFVRGQPVLPRRSCTWCPGFKSAALLCSTPFSLASCHALVHSLLQYFRCA